MAAATAALQMWQPWEEREGRTDMGCLAQPAALTGRSVVDAVLMCSCQTTVPPAVPHRADNKLNRTQETSSDVLHLRCPPFFEYFEFVQVLHLCALVAPNHDTTFSMSIVWTAIQLLCSSFFLNFSVVSWGV